ncbi:lipoyl(octanoyl) transferase LipB [Tessaracoccus sp.]
MPATSQGPDPHHPLGCKPDDDNGRTTRVNTTFEYLGLGEEPVLSDFNEVWAHQRRIHADVATGARPGHVIFVQHTPVYTAGRRTEPHERPFDGTPVIDVDRGGKITYHGPGQLVGYPIVRLPDGIGVVDHVRRLEEAIIRMLSAKGLRTRRIEGRTGVWLDADATRPQRKICAIGVRVAQRTAMHGFALNVEPSTTASHFANIVPCGIADAGVTSLAEELPGLWSVAGVAHDLEPFLADMLAFGPYAFSSSDDPDGSPLTPERPDGTHTPERVG